MTKSNLIPQYKDVKFDNTDDFNSWLKEKAKFKIELVDNGQDLQQIWIDEHGEILYTDMQSTIWCSLFVDIDHINIGEKIRMNIIDDLDDFINTKFVVESFTELQS